MRGICFFLPVVLLVGGCQSSMDPYTPIAEHRPNADSPDYVQSEPAIISLYRWQPSSDVLVPAGNRLVPVELPSEVKRLMVDSNSPIGFRRHDGQLLATAGGAEIPLPEGHYSWQILTEDPRYPAPETAALHGSVTFGGTGYDPQTDRIETAGVGMGW